MSELVLVTGGSGYVAGYCIVELLRRGYRVRTTLRSLAKVDALRAAVQTEIDPGKQLTFAVADLEADAGWEDAVKDCAYVLHVASPLLSGGNVMQAALDGTLRVLRAATKARVKRVVMTSSTAVATPLEVTQVGDEEVWTSDTHPTLNPYRESKIAAEKAAWAFMKENGGETRFTTVLPGAVFGPVLSAANLGSVQFVERLLNGKFPGVPHLGFCVVDVRDLASLHVNAMEAPAAAGQRFIGVSNYLWMDDIARVLRTELGARASKLPTRRLPSSVLRLLAVFVRPLRALTPLLDRQQIFSAKKAYDVLGFSPRPSETTILDCARRSHQP